jgi:hypothetical protein
MQEPDSSPHSYRSSSRIASFASVLCPFRALACDGPRFHAGHRATKWPIFSLGQISAQLAERV